VGEFPTEILLNERKKGLQQEILAVATTTAFTSI
jgi:hypothetical protein